MTLRHPLRHPLRRTRRAASSLLVVTAALAAAVVPAGTSATASPASVLAEADPDAITVTPSLPPPDRNGWFTGPTTLTLDVASPLGILGPGSVVRVRSQGTTVVTPLQVGANQVPIGDGTTVVSWEARRFGTSVVEASGARTVFVDASAPSIDVSQRPGEGAVVPQGAQERLVFGCLDAMSTADCVADGRELSPVVLDTSTPGFHRWTVTGTDEAGNVGTVTGTYRVLGRDTTAPEVTRTELSGRRGTNGWFRSAPTFGFSAVDPDVADHATSGFEALDTDLDGEVTEVTTPTTQVVVPEGRHTLKWAARDRAGNASGIGSMAVDVDPRRPTATVSYPAEGAHLGPDDATVARHACADALSGVASCAVRVDGVATSRLALGVGSHTVEVVATDRAGNTQTLTRGYVVDPRVASTTTLATPVVSSTQPGTVSVVVSSTVRSLGRVTVREGSVVLGTAVVDRTRTTATRSTVTVSLPRLTAGTHRLTASYAGSAFVLPSTSATRTVTVR